MHRFNTALFGTGFVGRVHLEAIRRLGYVKLYAIGEREIEKAKRLAAEFGAVRAEADYHALLEDPEYYKLRAHLIEFLEEHAHVAFQAASATKCAEAVLNAA